MSHLSKPLATSPGAAYGSGPAVKHFTSLADYHRHLVRLAVAGPVAPEAPDRSPGTDSVPEPSKGA